MVKKLETLYCERCSEKNEVVIHNYGESCPILEKELMGPDIPINIQVSHFKFCPHCGKDLLTGEHHE